MSQNYYGSICITDLLAKAKEQHSAFTKAQNGKIYCNVSVWLNDEQDKFGNIMSILLSSKKEMKDKEDKFYIGNCKKSEYKEPEGLSGKDAKEIESLSEDLPF